MSYHNQAEDDSNILEPNGRRNCALIGAMMDGWVESFEFRGLRIVEERGFIKVENPNSGRQLGYKTHMKGASIGQVYDWLENKADLYRRLR